MRPSIDHDDLVGLQDRADALRHDEAGVPIMLRFQRVLDLRLGLHVDRAGAVVQDQDLRARQQRAGDGEALLLPAREVDAALLDVRVVAVAAARRMKSCACAACAAAITSSSLASGRP